MTLLAAWLSALAILPAGMLDAVTHAESRGTWSAVSRAGCVGVMQVCPRWAEVPRWALFLPAVNRLEGARLLAYWHRRAHGDWQLALAAYRCGNAGLRGRCGVVYARGVLARMRKACHSCSIRSSRKSHRSHSPAGS